MAKLVESYEVPGYSTTSFDEMEVIHVKHKKTLEDLEKQSKKATAKNPVGLLMKFSAADGYAIYRVVKAKPLTLQHVPLFDGYRIPDAHVRGITMEEVKQQIRWNEMGVD